DREGRGHLPRQCRIDVDRLDIRLQSLVAANPPVAVLGDEPERNVDPDAERPLRIDWYHEIGGPGVVVAAGIAAGAAERLVGGRQRTFVVEPDRGRDDVE